MISIDGQLLRSGLDKNEIATGFALAMTVIYPPPPLSSPIEGEGRKG
jgi:hypothetical protein